MASLTAKVIKGKTYYYARECQRVGGKPKIVRTVYLGSLDNNVSISSAVISVALPAFDKAWLRSVSSSSRDAGSV